MLDAVQKLVPWATDLPLVPKIAITVIFLLIVFIFLYLVWVPGPKTSVADQPSVKKAYGRMVRVLARIQSRSDGQVVVDGNAIEPLHKDYYVQYLKIAEYIRANPGDIEGAYESVWENGGSGRVYTSDTQAFEAVVSGFFHEWELARGARSP